MNIEMHENFKWINIGVPEEGMVKKIFEYIVAESFPNFTKTVNSQIK